MEHEHTEHVAADPDRLYAAISNVDNLPKFVPQLTGAHSDGGDTVSVDARYHGKSQHGEAYFRTSDADRRIEWGTASGYKGWMQVDPDGEHSRLTLYLNTVRTGESDHDISSTLDAIRMLVEAEV